MKKNKLHQIKNSGFKTPEDYFSNLEETILTQINLEEKVTKTGLKTPENYFESIEDRIISQISNNQESKVISLVSKRTIIAITSIAAAITILFNLVVFDNNISFDGIDTESLENYVSTQEFEALDLEAEIIEDLDISSFILDEAISDVSLENYLYNTSDLEDFISE